MTRPSVLAAFPSFTAGFEGRLPFMYLDELGLVTCAVGDLVDPVRAALVLPWQKPDGSPASIAEITACWQLVKSRQDLKNDGGGVFETVPGNDLRLTDEAIDELVMSRFHVNETILRRRFLGYDSFCADGQLGFHSMSWAMGAWFRFPKFQAAVNRAAPDWATAADECEIEEAHPNRWLLARNAADRVLFRNAEYVAMTNADPDILLWPSVAWPEPLRGG